MGSYKLCWDMTQTMVPRHPDMYTNNLTPSRFGRLGHRQWCLFFLKKYLKDIFSFVSGPLPAKKGGVLKLRIRVLWASEWEYGIVKEELESEGVRTEAILQIHYTFSDWFLFCTRSPVGVTESTPELFGNTWKTSSACVLVHDSSQVDPCDVHLQAGGQWRQIFTDKCIST